MHKHLLKIIAAASLFLLSSALMAEERQPSPPQPPRFESVELKLLLDQVSSVTKKKFLVAEGVPAQVTLGTVDKQQLDYGLLLKVLYNKGLSAYEIQDTFNVVHAGVMRR